MKELSGKKIWNFVHKTVNKLKKLPEEQQAYRIAEISLEYPKNVIHLIEDELRDYKKEQLENEEDMLFFEASKENIYKKPEGYDRWSTHRERQFEKNRLRALRHLKKEERKKLKRKEFLELVRFKIEKSSYKYTNTKETYKLVPKDFRPITHKEDSNAVEYAREVLYLFSLYAKHHQDTDIIHLSKEQQWMLGEFKKGLKGKFSYLFWEDGTPKITKRKVEKNIAAVTGEKIAVERKKDLKKDVMEDEDFLKKLGGGSSQKGKDKLKELSKKDWYRKDSLSEIEVEALEKLGYTSGLVYDFKANRVSVLAYNEAGWTKESMQHFSKAYFTKEIYSKTEIRVKTPGVVVDAVLITKNNKKIAVEFEQIKSSDTKTKEKIDNIMKNFELLFIVCKESCKEKYNQFKSGNIFVVNNGEFYQYIQKLPK